MSVVLDTSILIDHLRASTPATEYLASLDPLATRNLKRFPMFEGLRPY